MKIKKIKIASFNKLTAVFIFTFIASIMPVQTVYSATYLGTAKATVTIGSGSSNCPQGWSATGSITQGPMGHTSHGDPPVLIGDGGLEAIDIGTPIGTPVYATVKGKVTQNFINGGSTLDQRIAVQPSCPGLDVVYYWHLSSTNVKVGDTVTFGQQIGSSGLEGTGAHTHYQFNNAFNRTYSISDPPHVPVQVPRYCDGVSECGITIKNAP